MLALSVSAVSAAQQHPEDSLPALWDLQKCLDHAVQNNISIRQSRLDTESAETDLKTAKAALFPSLFFSTGHSLINRPFQDSGTTVSGTEIISSDAGTSYTGNYGLDASWTLYNGGENRKNTRLQELECEISRLDTEETVKTIEEEIIQLYIQILYSSEAVAICRNTLDVSLAQVERGKELYEEGTLSKADLSQLQAQASSDRYNLVSSETTLQDYRLQLKQSVYASALESRPEVLSGKLDVDAAELNIAISKAGYLPSLTLSAGIGTNHTSGTDYSFSEQIRNGWNNTIGLTLSIPISSKRQNKSAVEKARIQYSMTRLELEQTCKDLYKKIENIWLDATSAQTQFAAAKDQETSAETSYALVSEQFSLGMKNTVELLTEKNNLSSARQQALQAKYMAILSIQLMKFYNGEDLTL